MKKGIYITTYSDSESVGVKKKVDSQIKVLSNYFDVKHVHIPKRRNKIKKILSILPGGSISREYESGLDEIKRFGCDFAYIRKGDFDRGYLKFLKTIRNNYSGCKIIMEFPTYPYDNEYLSSKTMIPWFFKDKIYRKRILNLVDRIVTYSSDDYILNVKTLKTKNGFLVDDIDVDYDYKYGDSIVLIAVASMQKHHGYERIIKGISEYKKSGYNKRVVLELVGEGGSLQTYKELVKQYKLEDEVIFCGKKTGKELTELYQNADIGLGSFGFHIIGAEKTVSSTLKTREYLAYGMPFISACVEDVFIGNPDCEFYLKYPDDETSVPIDEIVAFYERLKNKYSKIELRKMIHDFAKNTIDMSVVMQPIVDYLEE
ncbi:glycosyltransferase [Butyrivibrio sp. AE2032]|uniref:glycosyltransferase n=1 Tax=Butyrivibrio sp. AE2032 TaxID=1458463 RepID=UPI0005529AC0|nr:glycosyltransferase [Butyrivibrio sp. AE2032]